MDEPRAAASAGLTPDEPAGEIEWHRLHPVTVIRELLSLLWNFVAALVVSRGVGDFDVGPEFLGFSLGVEDILAVVFLGFGFIRYLATRYAVTDQVVMFRRGVIFRSRTVLPRDRIQNVTIGADLVARVFSMQTLTVSSAGSEGEIELAVVSKSVARQLSADLTATVRPAGSAIERTVGSVGAGPVDAGSSDASLIDAGSIDAGVATSPTPFGGEGVACPPAQLEAPPTLEPWYTLTNRDFVRFALTSNAVGAGLVFAVVSIASLIVLDQFFGFFFLIGVVAPIVLVLDLFGFAATTDGDRVRVQHGMFSTREKWARLERIQLGDVRRPWFRRRFGFETLAVATADVTESANGQFDLCAPVVPLDSWRDRFATLGLATELDEESLVDVSKVTIRRRTVRGSALPVVALAGLLLVLDSAIMRMMTVMMMPMVVMAAWMLAKRSFRVDGWALGSDHLLVRRGLFDERLLLVRLEKVQSVSVTSTFFQRRLGLASINVDTANVGVTTTIPDLVRDEADRLSFALMIAANTTVLVDGV